VLSQPLRSRRRVIRLGRDGVTLLPLPVASGDAATMRLQWLQGSILNPHDLSSGPELPCCWFAGHRLYTTGLGSFRIGKEGKSSLSDSLRAETRDHLARSAPCLLHGARSLHHGEFLAGCLATELHRTPLLGHLVMIHLGKGARRFRALWARGVWHALTGAQSRPLTSLP
jgi:hypothetical protein